MNILKKYKPHVENTLLYLLASYVFFELFNSIILYSSDGHSVFGQIFKLLIFGIAFIVASKKGKIFIGGATVTLILFSLLHTIEAELDAKTILIKDLQLAFRILLFPTLLVALKNIEFNEMRRKVISDMIISTVAVIVINIIMGMFGLGFTQYALGYGYKGFFYSGNEMVLVLLVTYATLLYWTYKNKKFKHAIALSIILLPLAFTQGMKTLLIGIPLVTILIPLITIKIKNTIYTRRVLIGGSIIIVLVGIIGLAIIPKKQITRLSEIYERNGIIGVLTGERDQYIVSALHEYKDYNLGQKLWGVGIAKEEIDIASNLRFDVKWAESDPIDLLMAFGLLGTLTYYGIWMGYTIHESKRIEARSDRLFLIVINGLLMIMSAVTGHVIYSTFLAGYWAVANTNIRN